MSDYYPEFYLRKRQREQAYRRATVVAVGFLTLLAVGGIVGYLIVNAVGTRRTEPGATPELAAQQQELQTRQQLASAAVPESMELAADQPSVDLTQISYSESFPKVSVSVAGAEPSGSAASDPATGDPAAAAPAADEPASEPVSAAEAAPSQPSPQDERVSSVTPSSDEAQRKAEQQKRQEQARREAEKREAAKRAEEKQRREEAKSRQAEQESKPEAEPSAPSDVRAPAKSGGYSYTVYGGTFLTAEDAERKKSELGALGLSGSIIQAGGDHLLLIGKFDDEDSAKALRNKLSGSGFGGAFVTRKAK